MKDSRVLLAGFLLVAATLACNLPTNPQPPIPSLTPSTGDADAFESNFQQAVNQASQTGIFNVTITQQQLSSWLALRAQGFAQQHGYEWPFKNVQAGLDNGKIILYGVIVQPNVPETPAQVIFTPSIDGNGQLAVKIESGQVGIVGMPSDVLNKLTDTIRNILTGQLAQIQGRYRLTNLTIANGGLTVCSARISAVLPASFAPTVIVLSVSISNSVESLTDQ